MKQYEAVIKVMEQNGGYATLGLLYQKVLKVKGVTWKTKTPFASIRRIVQDERFFFKIIPGLWAMKGWEKRLPAKMKPATNLNRLEPLFNHTYYQGLLLQLGNIKNFETFVPSQDKKKLFLGKEQLQDLATHTKMLAFSYPSTLAKAQTIDVVWFNSRKFPDSVFEVEHSTNIKNSLIKFVKLQDFRTDMVIVADKHRFRQFQDIINLNAFTSIKNYVRFMSYQKLSDYHSHVYKLKALEENIYNNEQRN